MPRGDGSEWWRPAAWVAGALLALPAIVLALLHSSAVATRLAETLVPLLAPWPDATWASGRVDLDGLRTITLEGVRVHGATSDGAEGPSPDVRLPHARASFELLPLLGRRLVVQSLEVSGLDVVTTQRPDSTWDLQAETSTPEDTTSGRGGAWAVEIRRLAVSDAGLRARFGAEADSVLRVERAMTRVHGLRVGGRAPPAAVIDTAHVVLRPPGATDAPVRISAAAALEEGRLDVRGFRLSSGRSEVTARGDLLLPASDTALVRDVDFRLAAEPLHLSDVAAFLPGFEASGAIRLHARARGSARTMEVEVRGRGPDDARFRLDGTLTPTLHGPLAYELHGEVAGVDPARWGGPEAVSGVGAALDVSLAGPAPDSLSGRVSMHAEARRAANGSVDDVSLEATLREGIAELELTAAASPWGRVEAAGTVSLDTDDPWYDLRAELAQDEVLELGSTRLEGARADVRLEGRGFAPEEASGQATVDAAGTLGGVDLRDTRLTGTWEGGSARADLTLGLEAGRVEAGVGVDWSGEAVRLELAELTARNLDVAPLTQGSLSGILTLDGSGSMVVGDPSSPRADLAGALGPLAWEGDAVADSGRVALEVREGAADLEAGLFADAGLVRLEASARPFDPDRAWVLEGLEVAGLDLSKVRPGLPPSDVTAVLRMEGRLLPEPGTARPSETTMDSAADAEAMARRLLARGALAVRPSTIGSQRVDTAHVEVSFADGALEVTGGGAALEGRFSLDARARPAAAVPTFDLRQLHVEEVHLDSTLAGALEGVFTGTLRARGALPSEAVPRVAGRLDLAPSPLDVGQVASGRATFGIEDARARLDAHVSVQRGSARLAATGDLARAPDGALGVEGLELDGRIDLPDARRALGADTLASALDARFALSSTPEGPGARRWSGSLSASGRLGGARLDTLELRGRAAGGVLHLDTLLLASNVASGEGGGAVAFHDSAAAPDQAIHARIVADSLYAAQALAAVRPLSIRGGAVYLDATHAPGGVRVDARLGLGGLLAAAFAADTLAAEGAVVLRGGALTRATGRFAGENLGWGAAFLDAVGGEVTHDTAATRFALSAAPDSAHQLRVRASARTAARLLELEELTMVFPEEEWRLARRSTVAWGDTIEASEVALVSGARRIVVDGVLNRDGEQDLTVTLDSVSFDAVADLAGLGGVRALLDGTVHVIGPADDVALDGSLTGYIGDASLDVAVRPEGRDLDVDARLGLSGRTLAARGRVPFAVSIADGGDADGDPVEGRLGLSVTAEEFALGWLTPFLEPLGVAEWRAWLTADARVEGTLEDPSVRGSAMLAGGGLRIPEQGISYQEISADVAFAGDRIDVRSLHLTAGGSADARGTLRLATLARPEFDLDARFDRFRAVHNEWTRLGISGEVSLTGDIRAPVVRGSLAFTDTDFFADPVGTAAGGTPVELTPEDYAMLEQYFGYTPEREDAVTEDPLEPLAMDLAVELESDVWLRRQSQPELQLQLDGSVDVRKEAGDSIQLFGTIEILPARSYVEQLGRRFDVTSGTATFNGSMWDWRTEFGARYEVPSVRDPTAPEATITLEVTGGMDDLQLTLGSEPAMETADILSYIATGRPAASAVEFGQPEGGGGGVIEAGATLALEQAASALERTAAESVGLDVVEIRHRGREGTTLIAGRYVSPRLFVGFEQPLALGVRSDDAVSGTARTTEVDLEYTATDWLLLILQGGQSTLRFFLRTRHAF